MRRIIATDISVVMLKDNAMLLFRKVSLEEARKIARKEYRKLVVAIPDLFTSQIVAKLLEIPIIPSVDSIIASNYDSFLVIHFKTNFFVDENYTREELEMLAMEEKIVFWDVGVYYRAEEEDVEGISSDINEKEKPDLLDLYLELLEDL